MLSPQTRLKNAVRHSHRERYWDEYDRDDYAYPSCGYEAQGIDRGFHVHHIDGDWLNGHLVNLVALCARCHRHVHQIPREVDAIDDWKDRVDGLGGPLAIGVRPTDAEVTDV